MYDGGRARTIQRCTQTLPAELAEERGRNCNHILHLLGLNGSSVELPAAAFRWSPHASNDCCLRPTDAPRHLVPVGFEGTPDRKCPEPAVRGCAAKSAVSFRIRSLSGTVTPSTRPATHPETLSCPHGNCRILMRAILQIEACRSTNP